MRKFNVFGQKQTQVRPFYVLLVIFILLVPIYFLMNYFQTNQLEDLEGQTADLQLEINRLLITMNNENPSTITEGMIDAGFQYKRFDYDIEEDISTLIYISGINYETDDHININVASANPLSINIPDDIVIKKIDLLITIDSLDNLFDFLELLYNQDQLFYIDQVLVKSLIDHEYRIEMTIYGFYKLNP